MPPECACAPRSTETVNVLLLRRLGPVPSEYVCVQLRGAATHPLAKTCHLPLTDRARIPRTCEAGLPRPARTARPNVGDNCALSSDPIADYMSLLDWRRRVAELYAEIRARIERDRVDAHDYWRKHRDDLFRNHPQSPLSQDRRAAFHGLHYYDYDARFAFTTTLRRVPEKRYDLFTSHGQSMSFTRVGIAELPIGALEVLWLDAYSGGVFLSFRDATTGASTYGGGRYLLDTAKGADLGASGDALVLDFNFSYNPSCAYDDKWSCPLPPPANALAVAIEAGERMKAE